MKVGFSLSPGGLLLPYHLGALAALDYHGFLGPSNPIAGASAGSIAVASYACGINMYKVLDACIDISDRCRELGGARGRLLPQLRKKLDEYIGEEEFHRFTTREGKVAITYRELFPFNRAVHQTEFASRHDLMNAVCHSSTFPMFTSNLPVSVDVSAKGSPRILVDGFFSVPLHRLGCPDFKKADIHVDQTVSILVFPGEFLSTGGFLTKKDHCICPSFQGFDQLIKLALLAVESSSSKEMTKVYESGWSDAEKWCYERHVHLFIN